MISSQSLKRVTLTVFAVLGLLSSGAFAGCTSGSQISMSVHPSLADVLDVIAVNTTIHNPTASGETIKVAYSLKLPNGTTQTNGIVIFPVRHGSSLNVSFSFLIPSGTALGTYTFGAHATNFATGTSVGTCSATASLVTNDGD
jgi:hypothetical protein